MTTGFISHPDTLKHDTGLGHPESSRRQSVIQERVTKIARPKEGSDQGLPLELIQPIAQPDLYQWVSKVHQTPYIDDLKQRSPQKGRIYLDPDTPLGPGSLKAAEWAVSGILTAVDWVMEKRLKNAFCAIRPPGHHAEKDHAMGFCLFNNVAIAAKYIQIKYGLERVLIIDWDVHHGNGTQNSFYSDPSVFYFSTHQFPCYPGTGRNQERGSGEGEGFTLNCPLPSGSGDRHILSKFEKELEEACSSFRPNFILISAGFDAHRDDPLAGLEVTESGFQEMTRIVSALAAMHCHGRIVSSLEGGYNMEALSRSIEKHLEVLCNFSPIKA